MERSKETAGWLAEVLDALFPRLCVLCGAPEGEGEGCQEHALPSGPVEPRCGRCGGALPEALADESSCAACRHSPPGFRRLIALGDYRPGAPLREWVLALKHRGRSDLAGPVGRAMGRTWLRRIPRREVRAAILVPVPLHPLRAFARGFDQAAVLARHAAEEARVPWMRALERVRVTTPQGAPGSSSRTANVRGAFGPRRRAHGRVEGRPVWLVDDVVTSGATAAECARVLRRMGAVEVSVLCAARASP